MQTKFIKAEDYLLLVDMNNKLFYNQYVVNLHNNDIHIGLEECLQSTNKCTLILAYLPLTKDAKELNLPLLPPFEKVDFKNIVEDLPEHDALNSMDGTYSSFHYQSEAMIKGYELGYKAAQQSNKQYSLDDVLEFLDLHTDAAPTSYLKSEFRKYSKSLSTQQLPKEFVISDKFSTFEENIKNGKYKW